MDERGRLVKKGRKMEDEPCAWSCVGGAGTNRGTGGMVTKIEAAEVATKAGINMIIANGNNIDALYDILDGNPVGTLFVTRDLRKED